MINDPKTHVRDFLERVKKEYEKFESTLNFLNNRPNDLRDVEAMIIAKTAEYIDCIQDAIKQESRLKEIENELAGITTTDAMTIEERSRKNKLDEEKNRAAQDQENLLQFLYKTIYGTTSLEGDEQQLKSEEQKNNFMAKLSSLKDLSCSDILEQEHKLELAKNLFDVEKHRRSDITVMKNKLFLEYFKKSNAAMLRFNEKTKLEDLDIDTQETISSLIKYAYGTGVKHKIPR